MTKFIGLTSALVVAIGVTLAMPATSDACGWGRGCGYSGACCYCSPVAWCGPTSYCCYGPVVPYYRTSSYSVVGPGYAYSYYPQVIASAPPAGSTFSVTSQAALDNSVQMHVVVPASAKVWFNDSETRQVGTDRHFTSPPLIPGSEYTYDVKARWLDQNGKEVTQVRHVSIRANAQIDVNFTQPAP